MPLAEREHVLLVGAVEERVRVLHPLEAREPALLARGERLLELRRGDVARADRADRPGAHELVEGRERVRDRRVGVGGVDEVEVDALQRRAARGCPRAAAGCARARALRRPGRRRASGRPSSPRARRRARRASSHSPIQRSLRPPPYASAVSRSVIPSPRAASRSANASSRLSPCPKKAGADPIPPKFPQPSASRETATPDLPELPVLHRGEASDLNHYAGPVGASAKRLTLEALARAGLLRPAFRAYERAQGWRLRSEPRARRRPAAPARVAALRGRGHDGRRVVPRERPRDDRRDGGRARRATGSTPATSAPCSTSAAAAGACSGTARTPACATCTGATTTARLVSWCARNLPFARVARNEPAPPTRYEAGAFGLTYALSVFTHLSFELQRAWIDELARITRPGGHLILTTHGEGYLPRMTGEERRRFHEDGAVRALGAGRRDEPLRRLPLARVRRHAARAARSRCSRRSRRVRRACRRRISTCCGSPASPRRRARP